MFQRLPSWVAFVTLGRHQGLNGLKWDIMKRPVLCGIGDSLFLTFTPKIQQTISNIRVKALKF